MKEYKKEWSLGNGQCPDCLGCGPEMGGEIVGHHSSCQLAKLMKIAGLDVVYAHGNKSKRGIFYQASGPITNDIPDFNASISRYKK